MTLDFVVFGVPRSGTTAATHALNLHPQIMCGNEYFPTLESAMSASMPQALEDESFAHTPNCEATRQTYSAKRETVRIFGNKDPRYFYYIDRFNTRLPACKKICIYRPRLEFWNSWSARASNLTDAHWDRGQTGFFGVLELFCLLGAVADIPGTGEVLLVNYDALFFDEPATIQAIYDYLGVGRVEEACVEFRNRLFSPAGLAKTRANDDATMLYSLLRLGELERCLFSKPAVTNIEAADALRGYMQASRTLVSDLIDQQFSRMSVREFLYFMRAKAMREALAKVGIRGCMQRSLEENDDMSGSIEVGLTGLVGRFDTLQTQRSHAASDAEDPARRRTIDAALDEPARECRPCTAPGHRAQSRAMSDTDSTSRLKLGCKLNLGCGFDHREGWVNVDLHAMHKPDIVCDVTWLEPVPDGVASFILAQDVLEHIHRARCSTALREWNRVMELGGELEIRVPDVLALARLMQDRRFDTIEGHRRLLHNMFGTQAYEGDFHLNGFTERTLRADLDDAGFHIVSLSHKDEWLFDVRARKARNEVPDAILRMAGDESFMDAAYLRIFGRPADAGGKAHFLAHLAQGTPREVILATLAKLAAR